MKMKQLNGYKNGFIYMVLILLVTAGLVQAATITVGSGADCNFNSIQAGIEAARDGDTVNVAPGTYYENVVLKSGVSLCGSGADVTIIDANGYGDVVNASADNVMISGFTLRNSGEFDLGHINCGVYIAGSSPVVKNNKIVRNKTGIGIWDETNPDIRHNVIANNVNGLYVYGAEGSPGNPDIINNTIVNNEEDGIILRVMVSPVIKNNIIVGHVAGINNNFVTGAPSISYNNLWHNDANYLRDNEIDDTLAGPGSISADPCFAEPGYWADINDPNIVVEPNDPNAVWVDSDYHLKSQAGRWDPVSEGWVIDDITSPCIDAGDPNSPVGDEPFPNGGRINMGAYGGTSEASLSYFDESLIIDVNEVDANSRVELEQGQILVITLESNPTTGYRWEVVEDQESILEQIGESEFKPSDEGEPPMAGAGGWEIFRFKAISAGQTTLRLVYRRPWEEGVEPINTFSINVLVN
jgi:inhibitor of cysteine peptidase